MSRLLVTTKSDYTRPIAASTVRTRLGLASSDDALLGAFIDQATSEMEDEVGRPLERQSYSEYSAGFGDRLIRCKCFPIDPNSVVLKIVGTTITVTTEYTVRDHEEGLLWYPSVAPAGTSMHDGSGVVQVERQYAGGWVMPEGVVAGAVKVGIADWTANATYAVGQWVRPTSRSLSPLLMECTTAGTVAATEPTWTSTEDAAITDSAATWTQRNASELPEWVTSVAFLATQRAWDRAPSGIKSMRAGEFSRTFVDEMASGALLSQRERSMMRRLHRP